MAQSASPLESWPNVSVCMATYNGNNFVAEQVESILMQLRLTDELVVVDDASTDMTIKTIEAFSDRRIRLIRLDRNLGHVRSFERAISEACGELIFLSDQDDVWLPGRVAAMANELMGRSLVVTEFITFGSFAERPTPKLGPSCSPIFNILGMFCGTKPYLGCTMAFRREMLNYVLPFPRYVEAHDHWLAISANVHDEMSHLRITSLRRRVHESNISAKGKRPIANVVWTRVLLARCLIEAIRRSRDGLSRR